MTLVVSNATNGECDDLFVYGPKRNSREKSQVRIYIRIALVLGRRKVKERAGFLGQMKVLLFITLGM